MQTRYSRQVLFDEIGKTGQEKLLASRVLLVGAGALGCAHAETLARAGVGFTRIVDRDFVEYTNLQRQTLYTESDAELRLPKAVAAATRLQAINSEITIEPCVADVTPSNIEGLMNDVDLIIDGTDNFQIRFLINDASVKLSKPWIYGAAVSSYGTTMTILPDKTPCLRCVFEELPDAGSSPTCDTSGVIHPIISSISAIQTTEAMKILTGQTDQLHKSLLQVDIWQNDWRKIRGIAKSADCKCCSLRDFEYLNSVSIDFTAVLCGRNAVQIAPTSAGSFSLNAFAERISNLTSVQKNDFLARFNADELEVTVFSDGRAIIRGTDDVSKARSTYSKFVGN